MIELMLIGIGTGSPEHLTLEAVHALNSADLVLIPRKGADKADLAELRRTICADNLTNQDCRVVEFDLPKRDMANPSYNAGVDDWHDAIATIYRDLIAQHMTKGHRAALLIWGDPSLYDSSLRIASRLKEMGLPLTVKVIPGLTSLQVLTAAHGITLNTIGAPFLVTTGRRLREHGWPAGVDTIAVMLDGDCAFQTLPPEDVEIWWGAYLGMETQMLLSGTLAEIGPRIITARREARMRHGWIMDCYLLRRTGAAA